MTKNYIKNLGIGLAVFAVITGTVFLFKYITMTVFGLDKESVGMLLIVAMLIGFAPLYGEMTVSVYNNTFKKQ